MNIFLIPFTPLRHTAVAAACAGFCLIGWWLFLTVCWMGAPWKVFFERNERSHQLAAGYYRTWPNRSGTNGDDIIT